jgi:hypothetical protein
MIILVSTGQFCVQIYTSLVNNCEQYLEMRSDWAKKILTAYKVFRITKTR